MFYKLLSMFLSNNNIFLKSVRKKIFVGAVLFFFSLDAFGNHFDDFGPFFGRVAVGGMRSAAGYLNAPAGGVTVSALGVFVSDSHMEIQSGLGLNYMASHAERYMGPLVQNVDGVDRFLSVSMPLNLGYCIGCVGGSIDPYAGVDVRLNMVGKSRVDGFECVDYFDDLSAKRFQLGLNAGVDVNFVIFYLGYRFTKDMTDFIPGMYSRNSCHKFVLGFNILY